MDPKQLARIAISEIVKICEIDCAQGTLHRVILSVVFRLVKSRRRACVDASK